MKNLNIAIVAAMLNVVLSLVIPSLLKDSHLPLADKVKKNYECSRSSIMVSSVLVMIFVYLSLELTPWVETNVFQNLAKLSV
jgi:hypothetical protein